MGRVRVRVMVGAAALALALGACGSDTEPKAEGDSPETSSEGAETTGSETTTAESEGRSAEDQAFVDDVVESLGADGGPVPDDEFECWVGGMVDGIGVDRMIEMGFTAESDSTADITKLSDADRKLVGDSFVKCVDVEAAFTRLMVAESGSEDLPKEVTDCMADLDWDKIETAYGEIIIAGTVENVAEDDPVMAPLAACMRLVVPDGVTG